MNKTRYHRFIEMFEEGDITFEDLWNLLPISFGSKELTDFAIEHNKLKTLKVCLDKYDIPETDITLEQRITYYKLFIKKKDNE